MRLLAEAGVKSGDGSSECRCGHFEGELFRLTKRSIALIVMLFVLGGEVDICFWGVPLRWEVMSGCHKLPPAQKSK